MAINEVAAKHFQPTQNNDKCLWTECLQDFIQVFFPRLDSETFLQDITQEQDFFLDFFLANSPKHIFLDLGKILGLGVSWELLPSVFGIETETPGIVRRASQSTRTLNALFILPNTRVARRF